MLDIFGGTGGVARAALKIGISGFVVDRTLGTGADACSNDFLSAFREAIVSCNVGDAMFVLLFSSKPFGEGVKITGVSARFAYPNEC